MSQLLATHFMGGILSDKNVVWKGVHMVKGGVYL